MLTLKGHQDSPKINKIKHPTLTKLNARTNSTCYSVVEIKDWYDQLRTSKNDYWTSTPEI